MHEVIRLANTPKGQPYEVEKQIDLEADEANKLVVQWWGSGGTLALVVKIDGEEDSRYVRDYLDEDRVPEDWERKKGRRPDQKKNFRWKDVKPAESPQEPEKPQLPPTMFNEDEESVEGPSEPSKAHSHLCWCCKQPVPMQGYPDDTDPTPSGRLMLRRCMKCGSSCAGMTHDAIYQQYRAGLKQEGEAAQKMKIIDAGKPS